MFEKRFAIAKSSIGIPVNECAHTQNKHLHLNYKTNSDRVTSMAILNK